MVSERLQGEEQFLGTTFEIALPCSHAKMCFKSAPEKLHFVMVKTISKSGTLDCSW